MYMYIYIYIYIYVCIYIYMYNKTNHAADLEWNPLYVGVSIPIKELSLGLGSLGLPMR